MRRDDPVVEVGPVPGRGDHDRHRLRPLPGRQARPAALVLAAFAVAIAIGSVLLALPISARSGHDIGPVDAFFTATSAVTVTGLGVVDTGSTWSPFGLGVILFLIQIGGLGVMTLAGFVGIVLTRRLRMTSHTRILIEMGLDDTGNLASLLVDLMRFVLLAEVTAGLALTARFWALGHDGLAALGHGFFHAVSAFNNAGFSTFDDSLAGEANDPWILAICALAFVIGGLGFPVVFELVGGRHRPGKWSLHTRITLSVSAALLVFGALLIGAAEWTNPDTLGELSVGHRIIAALFQSATTRTAGFNSFDLGLLRPGSILLMVILMVVGAGSASTGGGIKVTTLAVIIKAMLAEFRQDKALVLAGRRITPEVHREALALVVAAIITIVAGAFALSATSPELALADVVFETASAFGTVGLSTGVTRDFHLAGRLLLCVLMFVGRVGPVTFGTAVLLRPRPRRVGEPDGTLLIG